MKGDSNRFLARTDASAERKDWRCTEYWIIGIAGISYNDCFRFVKKGENNLPIYLQNNSLA